MTAQWKDATKYSRGDKERIPTVFEVKLGVYRLVVMSSHIYYPGQWVMTLQPLINEPRKLDARSGEEAQAKAVEFTRAYLAQTVADALANL